MSTFFMETLKARLFQNKEKYPLLKLNDLLNWQRVGDLLRLAKQRQRKDTRGHQGYDPLKMFKAVLLGQWHSLSDPELEHALGVRADFMVFCDFDDLELPDHSTLCRFRNWLIRHQLLNTLLNEINGQLEGQQLKVNKAALAVVDASIIETPAQPLKKALELEYDTVMPTPASKDSDATWTKKASRFYLGYKLHACSDDEGYFNAVHITPANEHEAKHLQPVCDGLDEGTRVLADKGYTSKKNRSYLHEAQLKDGIMHKAYKNKPLRAGQRRMNREIKKYRYVIEQSFGTLKRRFNFSKGSYFGLEKMQGQSYLKAMCVNLLKAMNKVSYA